MMAIGRSLRAGIILGVILTASVAVAAPPAPNGAHPRILGADAVTALQASAKVSGSVVAHEISKCDAIIANPSKYTDGGYQGFGFVESLSACLIAYRVRGDDASAKAAAIYFKALLDDLKTVGDGMGGDDVVRHDTGYSMRTYAPYSAIAYDWLHDSTAVDATLLEHARGRFKAWADWYNGPDGYHNHEPGANYHAGYLFAVSMISVAEGGEAGTDGDTLWTHVVDDIFGKDMTKAMAAGGVMDGGDWLEGWQYAPLSIAEYALSARVLRENGAPINGFATWENSVLARTIYATTPDKTGGYIGGDAETELPNAPTSSLTAAGILIDSPSPDLIGYASKLLDAAQAQPDDTFALFTALGQSKKPEPVDFPSTSATWYYAPGSRTLYARSSWDANAIWMVSQCAPRRISDHMFNDAGNIVLARGADNLIVDPSPYGSFSTLTGNGPTVASTIFPTQYQPGQGWWGKDTTVDFRWARQTQSGVIAARCDYAGQFAFQDTASPIGRAIRDIVILPHNFNKDAAMVLVDDVQGAAADRPMLLRLRSMGSFLQSGAAWVSTVGNSSLVVQVPYMAAGSPTVGQPAVGNCDSSTRGGCTVGRFQVGEWKAEVGAAHAVAFTVVDAVDKGIDPGASTSTTGTGWRGVEMDHGSHLAVIAVDPNLTTVTYTAAPGTHVVVGAPAGSTGRADVTAVANAANCDVTVAAHTGAGGVDARPVVVKVGTDCSITEDPSQSGYTPPNGPDPNPGTPGTPGGGGGGEGALMGGCCQAGHAGDAAAPTLIALLALRRRRRAKA